MLEFRADLHCHTTCSDGELSTQEILVLAKKEGLSGLSITDHDTVAAYAHLFPEAEKLGITLIPGVEFSIEVDETSIHVFGEGKPCFIPGHGFTIEETIALIHKAGGLAIIAHPHLVPPKILPKLCNLHFDGIEAHYDNFSTSKNTRRVTMAKKKAWLVTGGSDFHGSVNKANISLGCGFVS